MTMTSHTSAANYYCLICKGIVSAYNALLMPADSDYAGQAVCRRCACLHFDRTIKAARNHHTAQPPIQSGAHEDTHDYSTVP